MPLHDNLVENLCTRHSPSHFSRPVLVFVYVKPPQIMTDWLEEVAGLRTFISAMPEYVVRPEWMKQSEISWLVAVVAAYTVTLVYVVWTVAKTKKWNRSWTTSNSKLHNNVYDVHFSRTKPATFLRSSRKPATVSTPEDAEAILGDSEDFDVPPDRALLKHYLPGGLLTTGGYKWKNYRTLIAPMFSSNVVRTYVGTFNLHAKILVQKLKETGSNDRFRHEKLLCKVVFGTLVETTLGITVNVKMLDKVEFMDAIGAFHKVAGKHGLPQWVLSERLSKKVSAKNLKMLRDLPRQTLAEKKVGYRRNGKDDSESTLSIFMEAQRNGVVITDEEICKHLETILFCGYVTTNHLLNSFLTEMAQNLQVQETIHNELDSIYHDGHVNVTFADTLEMKYLERCILETLRLHPPVPEIARERQDVHDGKRKVLIDVSKLQRSEGTNPGRFDPDNFLLERVKDRPSFGYLPFGAGPRCCIGQKYALFHAKVLLATILRTYRIIQRSMDGAPKSDLPFDFEVRSCESL